VYVCLPAAALNKFLSYEDYETAANSTIFNAGKQRGIYTG